MSFKPAWATQEDCLKQKQKSKIQTNIALKKNRASGAGSSL
jgi:hypothetical protein